MLLLGTMVCAKTFQASGTTKLVISLLCYYSANHYYIYLVYEEEDDLPFSEARSLDIAIPQCIRSWS